MNPKAAMTKTVPRFISVMTDDVAPDSSKGKAHAAAFPLKLALDLITLYTERNELVLDPFCGGGTTLEAAGKQSRSALGVDIDPQFVSLARKRIERLAPKESNHITVRLGNAVDLRNSGIRDGTVDFILTSPPYWNAVPTAYRENDLASAATYEDFLRQFNRSLAEMFRVLKVDRCAALVTGGICRHRSQHGYIPFPAHAIALAQAVGFTVHDEIIWHNQFKTNKGKPLGSINAPYARTVHETILILCKRDPQRIVQVDWGSLLNGHETTDAIDAT